MDNIFQAVYFLRVYTLPVIIIIGTILNLLSFFVMRRIKSSTSFYFSILGLSDTLVLLTGGLNLWLSSAFNFYLVHFSTSVCKIYLFISYSMLDFSVWIIVLTTAEKLYAVSHPLDAHSLRTKTKKSLMIVIIAFFFCLVVNSHFLITHSMIYFEAVKNETLNQIENNTQTVTNQELLDLSICSYNKWNEFYEAYWAIFDATIYSFLPFSLISIFNVLILIYLKKAEYVSKKYKLHQLLETSLSNKTGYNYIFKNLKEKKAKDFLEVDLNLYNRQNFNYKKQSLKYINKRLIVLIFSINISFCILSMPMVILQIVQLHNYEHFSKNNKYFDLLTSIAEILQYLNHTTNFFFYSLSVRTFREQLKVFLTFFYGKYGVRL